MRITLIAAAAQNDVIGNKGQIPWRLPDDLKRFRALTEGAAVIMGRKTFQSIGRPLPNRRNIVVTRNPRFHGPGCELAASLEEALERVRADGAKEAFVIGGGEIYAAALPHANRIEMTRVHATVQGDARFPAFPEAEWHLVARQEHPIDERHADAFTFETWDRKAI